MNKSDIKKIANLSIDNGVLNRQVTSFVLKNLGRQELILYLRFLKKIISENSVRVQSQQTLTPLMRSFIQQKFKDKDIYYEVDETVGEGIKIIENDTVVDLTLKGYMDTALNNLKSN